MRILDTQIRSRFHVTIVGIQRGEKRMVGPNPHEILNDGDLLLIMGSQENLDKFKAELRTSGDTPKDPTTGTPE